MTPDNGPNSSPNSSPYDVDQLGQVFTPPAVVEAMLALRRNAGPVLEPSCGDGAFFLRLPGAVGIELDPRHCPPGALQQDFFTYPEQEKFATILGNPPYVRFQDIPAATRERLDLRHFDARTNLYLFFIEKCLRHLAPGGELIFITPRDFLKTTSSVRLNRLLHAQGNITDAIELGDARVFAGALPNCLIWRFERDCQHRRTRYAEISVTDDLAAALQAPAWEERHFIECAGHLMFAREAWPLSLADIASVKVGAVSGADEIYADPLAGNRDFVYSATVSSGQTRRMIWVDTKNKQPPDALLPHKERLISRRIRPFEEHNWWHWGRGYVLSDQARIYVNGRTRVAEPFFLHDCPHYDGAILAIFPHRTDIDLAALRTALNALPWDELGFRCDGRFLFTQRSLENCPLPASFQAFVPPAPSSPQASLL